MLVPSATRAMGGQSWVCCMGREGFALGMLQGQLLQPLSSGFLLWTWEHPGCAMAMVFWDMLPP